jgi:hypothetical protein
MSKKEIKATNNEVTTVDNQLEMFQGSGLDSGFEETYSESFKTPFVRILQSNSPEVLNKGEKYVKGAVPGMLYNTATGKLYDTLNVVVLKVVHNIIAWRPDRGGFVGVFSKEEEGKITARREGLRKWDNAGNDLDDTMSLYCVNHDDPTDIFIISLSRTGLKHARTFATRLKSLQINGVPISKTWPGVWEITSGMESNEKGSWYTIGSPKFKEFINKDFIEKIVKPGLEMLKTAKVDYSVLNQEEINVVDNDEDVKF